MGPLLGWSGVRRLLPVRITAVGVRRCCHALMLCSMSVWGRSSNGYLLGYFSRCIL